MPIKIIYTFVLCDNITVERLPNYIDLVHDKKALKQIRNEILTDYLKQHKIKNGEVQKYYVGFNYTEL